MFHTPRHGESASGRVFKPKLERRSNPHVESVTRRCTFARRSGLKSFIELVGCPALVFSFESKQRRGFPWSKVAASVLAPHARGIIYIHF